MKALIRTGIGGWLLLGMIISAWADTIRPTLLFSFSDHVVTAGSTVHVTLHALNPGSEEITWVAPKEISAWLRNDGQSVSVNLGATPSYSTEKFSIPPSRFVARQYLFAVPVTFSGEAILDFPKFPGNQKVIEIRPGMVEPGAKPESRIARWMRDAEPDGSPKSFDPARFFQEHISGYEPLYFIAGTETPNAKFQISFKYQIANRDGWLAQRFPSVERVYFAYTQTSLWDWNSSSAPFFDSSYKPEVLYAWEKVIGGAHDDTFRMDLQIGAQHESNGRDGNASRSLNIAYIRPTFVFGGDKSLQLTLQPRAWFYVGDLDDNPDLTDYRGYADLRAIIGWKRGLQLSTTARVGDTFDHGSLQFDLTYPMMRFFYSNFSFYLHAQYFTGYGESLLRYDQRSSAFRIGVSMYR